MRGLASAFVAYALVLTSGCQDVAGGGGALHGSVRDAATGKAIAGAVVTYTSDTLAEVSGRSGSDGRYSLAAGSLAEVGRVRAAKMGYVTAVASVYFDADTVQVDLTLQPL